MAGFPLRRRRRRGAAAATYFPGGFLDVAREAHRGPCFTLWFHRSGAATMKHTPSMPPSTASSSSCANCLAPPQERVDTFPDSSRPARAQDPSLRETDGKSADLDGDLGTAVFKKPGARNHQQQRAAHAPSLPRLTGASGASARGAGLSLTPSLPLSPEVPPIGLRRKRGGGRGASWKG